MSIPTPSDFAKHLKARKQLETQPEPEQQKSKPVRKNTPRAKVESSNTPRAKVESSNKRPSKQSRSTKTDSAASRSPKTSTEKVSSPTSSPTTQRSGEPGKKPFVRREHLTQRLSSNEALKQLRESMPSTGRRSNRTSTTSSKK